MPWILFGYAVGYVIARLAKTVWWLFVCVLAGLYRLVFDRR